MKIFKRLSTKDFKSSNLSIWELSDLEYFTHVLVDYQHFEDKVMTKSTFFDSQSSSSDEDQQNQGFSATKKPGLYDYIDSIGKIQIEREDSFK